MDDPSLDETLHRQALAGLRRVNQLSFPDRVLWHVIRKHAQAQSLEQLRILDVACGGGDVGLAVADRASKAGYRVELVGCDLSRVATDVAQQKASRRQSHTRASIDFINADAIHEPLPSQFDVVMCSLFLHHLDEPEAIQLLANMRSAARSLVLVDDLRRTRLGFALAWLGTRVLSRSRVVHVDGPRSVKGAFTCAEALAMAERAGMPQASCTHHWPQRFLLQWSCAL